MTSDLPRRVVAEVILSSKSFLEKAVAKSQRRRHLLSWWIFYWCDGRPPGANSATEPMDLLQNSQPEKIAERVAFFYENEDAAIDMLKRAYPAHAAAGIFD